MHPLTPISPPSFLLFSGFDIEDGVAMLNMALPMFQNLVKKDVFQVLIYASFRINEVLQAHHINVDEDVPMVIREALKKFEVDVTHIVGTPFGFKVTKKARKQWKGVMCHA